MVFPLIGVGAPHRTGPIGTESRTDWRIQSLRREILVSASSHETWVALLEDRLLVELMFDRPDQGRLVGDIYLGRVEAVLPGIQAAFVDIGTEKAGFLHVYRLAGDMAAWRHAGLAMEAAALAM